MHLEATSVTVRSEEVHLIGILYLQNMLENVSENSTELVSTVGVTIEINSFVGFFCYFDGFTAHLWSQIFFIISIKNAISAIGQSELRTWMTKVLASA